LNLSNKQLILIQKYLDKDLSKVEQMEFDENLKLPEFKEQLLFQAQLVDSIGADEHGAMRIENKKNAAPNIRALLVRLAAAVLMIFAILFALKSVVSDNEAKVYANYFEEYPANTSRNVLNTDREEFNLAMKDYAEGNYQLALNRWQAIPEQNEELSLYIANCYINLEQDDEALKLLGGMKKSINVKYRNNAEWYSLLTYLKQKDLKYKKDLEKILSDSNHLYYLQAKELAADLK